MVSVSHFQIIFSCICFRTLKEIKFLNVLWESFCLLPSLPPSSHVLYLITISYTFYFCVTVWY